MPSNRKPNRYPERVFGRVPEHTLSRIDATLRPGEDRAAWLREAVGKLLATREAEVR